MALTRALLLTDVVDSTALVERLGAEEAARCWAAHDRVARDLLATWSGREIDKTDGFLLLFESAPDAVGYALAYHRALRALDTPLRARAGLHVGEVVLRDNSSADIARGAKPIEVEGLAKPMAARVMSLAIGGQTLLSKEAVQALASPPERLLCHGHWRMKGVAEPVEIFEVGDGEAPFLPPPDAAKVYRVVEREGVWLPAREVRHFIPAERDAFVGRTADLQALAQLLEGGARLVSVLGMGGTGKTRLVTRFGRSWLGDWPGGVWFCDLSDATTLDGVVSAVAGALGVRAGAGDQVVQLGHAIEGRGRCLVIMDNFEQVTSQAEATVGRWLDRAPEASFLVTTREVLGLAGEATLALAPLPAQDGASLFLARACDARAGFAPTPAELPVIDELVALLDGLPLAIELAAARVRMMPVGTILERMSDRFRLLAGASGRRTRQATLRGALDWSWDLLAEWERSALAQCSVFDGGLTVEAAEAVLDLSAWPDAPWPMDAVQALVDKSLVRRVGAERLEMLVSVREYAAERLRTETSFAGAGAAAVTAAESRHGEHHAQLARTVRTPVADGVDGIRRRLMAELDNFIGAVRRGLRRGDPTVAAWCLQGAWVGLEVKGPYALAAELAEAVLAAPDPGDEGMAVASLVAADSERLLGRMASADAHLEAGLAAARRAGIKVLEAPILAALGRQHLERADHDAALEIYASALTVAREIGDRVTEGQVLGNLGNLFNERDAMKEASEHHEAALAILRTIGDRRVEGMAVGNLGAVLQAQGRTDEARAQYQQALDIFRDIGDVRLEGHFLGNVGVGLVAEGKNEEALDHYQAGYDKAREVGDRRNMGVWLGNSGTVLMDEGRLNEARGKFEQALGLHREVGNRRFEGEVLWNLSRLDLQEGRGDDALRDCRAAEALLRATNHRSLLGSVLCLQAQILHGRGDPAVVRACLAEAEDIAATIDAETAATLLTELAATRKLIAET